MPTFRKPRALVAVAVVAWLLATGVGVGALWRYSTQPGPAADAPRQWPAESALRREPGRPTLFLVLHPRCPCSRATVRELAVLVAQAGRPVPVRVLFTGPEGADADWTHTDLWTSAAAIPGVTVASDAGGVETRRFGARTSGQTFLYDAVGELVFSGGITPARGHSGDNPGRTAILRLLDDERTEVATTPVFGCHLFDATPPCTEGSGRCEG